MRFPKFPKIQNNSKSWNLIGRYNFVLKFPDRQHTKRNFSQKWSSNTICGRFSIKISFYPKSTFLLNVHISWTKWLISDLIPKKSEILNLILQFFENCVGKKKSKFCFLGQFLTLKNMVTKFFRNSNFSDFLRGNHLWTYPGKLIQIFSRNSSFRLVTLTVLWRTNPYLNELAWMKFRTRL